MIYLIGGAPRVGKSVLCQQFAAKYHAGWISTDLLVDQLRVMSVEGVKSTWDATPEAIRRYAEYGNNIVHWSDFERGGHFAAMEAPDLLVGDVRTFFRRFR